MASVKRIQYDIDFVYTDNGQQFGTGALLSDAERDKLEEYLDAMVERGYITDPQIYHHKAVDQSYADVLKEIKAAFTS